MSNFETLTDIFRSSFNGDENSFEDALYAMKISGASLRDSVLIVAKELNLPLPNSDFIVLNSKTWLDSKEDTEQFRDKIHQILLKLWHLYSSYTF